MKCDKVDTTVCSAVGKRLKISKGVHELILSRLPTAEHTVVSTLSHIYIFFFQAD